MNALSQVWLGEGNFQKKEVALPSLRQDELIVELEAATVCGSDRHTVQGRRQSPSPSILGHEGVGRVIATTRPELSVGQRVVFSVVSSCGSCARCMSGFHAKCLHAQKVGHEPFDGDWPLSGTYSTHIHLRAGQTVLPVVDHVSDAAASIASCAIATVMAAFESAGSVEGKTVLVNGVGMLGLVALAEATRRGAARTIGCDPGGRTFHLAGPFADDLVTSTSGVEADVVLECSGSRTGVEKSLDTLEMGGTAVLVGSVAPAGTIALDPEWVVRGWRTIRGVHNYEPRHLAQAVEFVERTANPLDWDAITGEPITLDDVPGELQASKSSMRRLIRMSADI
ncbi:zinc-binding dehydrogenase [Corynebacterium sp. CCUG 71335]|uniref:zinc-binding dehydrogenase n=1 Tax=Corynebacterium sp. CCUG 71335 TaxID=2823892 RepID=UPI00210B002C|nr:zinc-binding dehydrogenase [Corynebacterium sp. CCUG 71335]MCQ4621101.1 zinc-binding dehydrogenase [Corynebacterium sp. CCUG 71335]